MSRTGRPPKLAELRQAAELRASGQSWELVGQGVGRAAETVRKWPRRYRRRWKRALAHAELQVARDATSEAVYALRLDLREKPDERGRSAKSLLQYRLGLESLRLRQKKNRPPPPPKPPTHDQKIINYFRRITHELGTTLCRDVPA